MTKSFMQSKKETAAGLFGRALSAWPASRLVLEIVKTLHCMKSDRLRKALLLFGFKCDSWALADLEAAVRLGLCWAIQGPWIGSPNGPIWAEMGLISKEWAWVEKE